MLLLFVTVRRTFGPAAAVIAAVVAALTPAAVLMFRYNNPDALLTLLLLIARVGPHASLEKALPLARDVGSSVGLGFNAKFLQAYLVLPAFVGAWLISAHGPLRGGSRADPDGARRVLCSFWWVAIVEADPGRSAPLHRRLNGRLGDSSCCLAMTGWAGSSASSAAAGAGGPVAFPGPGASAASAAIRASCGCSTRSSATRCRGSSRWRSSRSAQLILSADAAGPISARVRISCGAAGSSSRARCSASCPGSSTPITRWSSPRPIGALVGVGVVELWRARDSHRRLAGLALAAAIASTAVLAWDFLNRTPDFLPGIAEWCSSLD